MHELSLVTEGDDKPLKYPDMFYAVGLMLLNKIDLPPYVDLGVERRMQYARQMNPAIQSIKLSAAKGGNFFGWIDRLAQNQAGVIAADYLEQADFIN